MTISNGIVLHKVKHFTRNLLKIAKPKTAIEDEWKSYFGSYCRCKDSLTWLNPDGTVACHECATNPINITKAVNNSITKNPTTGYVLCIDEGVQDLYATDKNITLCVPGCGILMQDTKQDLAKNIAKTAIQVGLTKIVVTSHSDCGAAGLAAQ
ncbi:MAG: hypothetical protein OHK0017_05250 [Patescibacteria group bacterium]